MLILYKKSNFLLRMLLLIASVNDIEEKVKDLSISKMINNLFALLVP